MNTNIFKTKELIKLNLFQKIFNKQPKINAFIEVNNLFSKKNILDITIEEIEAILKRYKINFKKNFVNERQNLYKKQLIHFIEDNELSEFELKQLKHLSSLLLIDNIEVQEIHNNICGERYQKEYNEALSDGKISEQEEKSLELLKANLKLQKDISDKISKECRQKYIDIQLNKITEDGMISPEEWEEFNLIKDNLNIDIIYNNVTQSQLNKMKLYWLIENGELPKKEVNINLQKNEVCYFSDSNVDWYETRTVTKKINYGGVNYRIKIMKGVYYRSGSVNVQRITTEELKRIDSGTIYVTNKRVIFQGNNKNTSISLSKILSVIPYNDGIGIEKDSGKSPILKVNSNADIFAMTLARVINDL